MDDQKAAQLVEELKKKLARAQRQIAALKERARLLEMSYDDAKARESNATDLVMELIERQHELNVMLNRAQTMLARTQEAMALTSLEFNEIAKALPEPKKAEFSERIAKINELFKKTGIEDADFAVTGNPASEQEREEFGDDTLVPDDAPSELPARSRWSLFWSRRRSRKQNECQAEHADDAGSQSAEAALF